MVGQGALWRHGGYGIRPELSWHGRCVEGGFEIGDGVVISCQGQKLQWDGVSGTGSRKSGSTSNDHAVEVDDVSSDRGPKTGARG